MYLEDDEGDDALKRDMLLRQSRILYPELEGWVLEMTVNLHIEQENFNNKSKITEVE